MIFKIIGLKKPPKLKNLNWLGTSKRKELTGTPFYYQKMLKYL